MLSHSFPEDFQCSFPIAGLGDKAFQHLALMIDSAPKIVPLAVDLYEHLVEVPAPFAGFNSRNAPLLNFRGKPQTETVPPVPDHLVANVDAPFVKQNLHVSERKWEPNVKHHRQADDLGARFEVFERRAFGHARTLSAAVIRLKRNSSDRTCYLPQKKV